MILFRYLFSHIVQSTFAVTLVLLLIVTSGRLSKYLVKASSGELAAEVVLTIILFRIPDFLPLIIPLGLFVGVLLVYGRMYVDSEMVVLSACGTSKVRILLMTLVPAFLVSMLVAVLTLWAAPASLAKVQELLEASKDFQSLALFREGKFQADQKGGVVYVEKLSVNDAFEKIFLVDQRKGGMMAILSAERGAVAAQSEATERQVTLENGVVYEGVIGKNAYQMTEFEKYTQRVTVDPQQEQIQLKIDALPTIDMLYSTELKHLAALHWRFSLPATVLVVAILAMALSRTDRRRGRYLKMLPAIVIYLVYILMQSASRTAIEEGELAPVMLWLVHATFLVFALMLLYRDDIARYIKSVNRSARMPEIGR